MKKFSYIRFILLGFVLFVSISAQSQVLIALLFGDKLNSDKLGFGMNVGTNFAVIPELNSAFQKPTLDLGLYFDVRLHPNFILRPEVYFTRSFQVNGMESYYLHDNLASTGISGNIEDIYDAKLSRKLSYVGIGAISVSRIYKSFYFDFGPDALLLLNATDKEYGELENNGISFTHKYTKQMQRIDPGLVVGASYRFREGNGVAITARYRFGFARYNYNLPQHHSSGFYILAGIPIHGVGKDKEEE